MRSVSKPLACQACGGLAAAGPLTRCPACRTALHADCLRYGGCPACAGTEARPEPDPRLRRLGAVAIDTALLLVVGLGALGAGVAGLALHGAALVLFAAAVATAAQAVNSLFFLGEGGATLGKKLMGLRVVDARGRTLGWRRALVREFLLKPMSELSLGRVFLEASRREPSWHDRCLGARLVDEHELPALPRGAP